MEGEMNAEQASEARPGHNTTARIARCRKLGGILAMALSLLVSNVVLAQEGGGGVQPSTERFVEAVRMPLPRPIPRDEKVIPCGGVGIAYAVNDHVRKRFEIVVVGYRRQKVRRINVSRQVNIHADVLYCSNDGELVFINNYSPGQDSPDDTPPRYLKWTKTGLYWPALVCKVDSKRCEPIVESGLDVEFSSDERIAVIYRNHGDLSPVVRLLENTLFNPDLTIPADVDDVLLGVAGTFHKIAVFRGLASRGTGYIIVYDADGVLLLRHDHGDLLKSGPRSYYGMRLIHTGEDGIYVGGFQSDTWLDNDLLYCSPISSAIACRDVVTGAGHCAAFTESSILCDLPKEGRFALVDANTGAQRRIPGAWGGRQSCRNAPCLFDVGNPSEVVVYDLIP